MFKKFWASQNDHSLQKIKFSQILGFLGFPIHLRRKFWAEFWASIFKILAENGQDGLKNQKKIQNFSNMFQNPSEYILGFPKRPQPSKTKICSNFRFFRIPYQFPTCLKRPFLADFCPSIFKTLAKNAQGMVKKF